MTQNHGNACLSHVTTKTKHCSKVLFWHDKWLDDKAPKEIAPNLYNLAHFKRRLVAKELDENNWIYAVRRITTSEELHEYIKLWDRLRNINLNGMQKDLIVWKWTPEGSYATASAYNMQFQGSYAPFRVGKLWTMKVEPKVKFFGWTAMHQKIMTADNLAARGMQHNNACPLCQQALRMPTSLDQLPLLKRSPSPSMVMVGNRRNTIHLLSRPMSC
jgi:hypothetical protein